MSDVPKFTITHDGVTVEAVVVQTEEKTIVQPLTPVVVEAGGSFTIESTTVIELD